jgi:hypothetical protein
VLSAVPLLDDWTLLFAVLWIAGAFLIVCQPNFLYTFFCAICKIIPAKDIAYTKECVDYLNAVGIGRFSLSYGRLPFSKFIDIFYEGRRIATYKRWAEDIYFPTLNIGPKFLCESDFDKYYMPFLLLGCLGAVIHSKLEQLYPDALFHCDFHYDAFRATGKKELYFGLSKFNRFYKMELVIYLPLPPPIPDFSNYDAILRAYHPSLPQEVEIPISYKLIAENGVTPEMLALLFL